MIWSFAAALSAATVAPRIARATVEFQKAFIAEYVAEHPDEEFAKFVKRKARCNLCHQGKGHDYENAYGLRLAELVDAEAIKDDEEQMREALRKVAEMPFDADAPDGETYGARIAASKLPAGELDDLKKEPPTPGEPLFDGESLAGWVGATDSYEARDGVIASLPGHGGNLFTRDEYDDFILRLQFRLTPGANNGIGIRAPLEGDAAYEGIELQVLDNKAEKYADLQPYQFHGSAYGVAPAKQGALKPNGQWNKQEVRCQGRQITVVLNGKTILDVNLDEAAPAGKTVDGHDHPGLKRNSGHIGFLGHGDVVEYRDITIKPLAKGAEVQGK